jgi:MoaA/NifB/PqqE/SkfB family radical SAM enzyme
MDVNLTQAEANALIAMPKYKESNQVYNYPSLGGSMSVPLISSDKRERFLLDVSHGQINLSKVKYQNRARQICILLRLELGGSPHRNPDGTVVPCPHIHIYRENYSDKWAFPIPSDKFTDTSDYWHVFQEFVAYCNVVTLPDIQKGL